MPHEYELADLRELSDRVLWTRLVDSEAFVQANDLVFSREHFLLTPCWRMVADQPVVVHVRWLDTGGLPPAAVDRMVLRARQQFVEEFPRG